MKTWKTYYLPYNQINTLIFFTVLFLIFAVVDFEGVVCLCQGLTMWSAQHGTRFVDQTGFEHTEGHAPNTQQHKPINSTLRLEIHFCACTNPMKINTFPCTDFAFPRQETTLSKLDKLDQSKGVPWGIVNRADSGAPYNIY